MSAHAASLARFLPEARGADRRVITETGEAAETVYVLHLRKGETRPSEEDLPEVENQHRRNEPIGGEPELMGIFTKPEKAAKAYYKVKNREGAHDRDKLQISIFTLDQILTDERFWLPDDVTEPVLGQYAIIEADYKRRLENVAAQLMAVVDHG